MRVVEVVWGDAWVDTGDVSIKKAQTLKPIKRSTVGYLVAENKDCVILCSDRYHKHKKTINTYMVIPWGWVYEYYEYNIIS